MSVINPYKTDPMFHREPEDQTNDIPKINPVAWGFFFLLAEVVIAVSVVLIVKGCR